MRELTITRRMPVTNTMALDVIERMPFAGDVAEASETAREAIAREVYEAMLPYKDGDVFVDQIGNRLVQVKKPAS